MKYYHGSRTKNLKMLTLDKSNDGYVWLAEQYEFAVLYGASPVRFWGFNKQTNKLVIREICESCFEKMYKNKKFYIYSATEVGEFEQSDHLGRKSIRCKHDVKLNLEETVEDAYKKIMELYTTGKIELRFWGNYTLEEKEKEKNRIIKTFSPVMQEEHDKFPEEYKLLTEMVPELKLENLTKN